MRDQQLAPIAEPEKLLQCLLLRKGPVQHAQKLLIADGLHGGGIPGQSHGQQGTNLVQQPLLHHLVHPAVDEGLHVGPVGELQADPYRVIPGRDHSGGGIVSGDGAAGFPVDLQRPEDPLCVGRVEALSAFRIYLPQLFQQGGDALPLKPGLQLPADRAAGVTLGKAVSPDQGVHPQPGSAYQNGQLAPRQNIVHHRGGSGHIFRGAPLLRRIRHGDHVVRDTLHLLRRGRGSPHCHAPVDLHGVHRHHFTAKPLCQQHAQRGFSAGGRPCDTDNFRRHPRPPLPWFYSVFANAPASVQAAVSVSPAVSGRASSPPANT